MCDTCNLTGGDSHQIPDAFLTEAAAALGAAQSQNWVSYSFPSSLTSRNQTTLFNTLEPALQSPIPNTVLHPRNARLPRGAVQLLRCPGLRQIWEETCPCRQQASFPALNSTTHSSWLQAWETRFK